jgi:flagellar hook-associated protein 1 FlgK
MAIGLLGTAASGLQVFQRAISVAGHNINNANTEGYTRQRVELGTREPSFTGQGYIGNGVQIESITRMFDQFVVDRLRDTTSTSSQYDTLSLFSARVSNLLGDSKAGLNAGLETFFNAVHDVADDPSSIPARQLLLSEAESLTARFQNLDGQLGSLRNEINGNIGTVVNDINGLSSAIAEANRSIVDSNGQGSGQVPNDLLDKRDQLINQLSELVSVRTVEQDDGAVNVFIGSGQALVTRFLASPLQVTSNDFDARRAEIAIVGAGAPSVITSGISGGKLGAVLDVRDQVLDPAQNALGRVATTLAVDFNAQHRLGMNLDGAMGGDFFALGAPQVASSVRNAGAATVSASFDTANIANLTIEDYELTYDGGAWVLSHASDGRVVSMSGAGTAASPFLADGLSIVVSGGAPVARDRFLIRPTRDASVNTGVLIGSPREVAAAAPVRITEATNANGLPVNTGNAAFKYQGADSSFSQLSSGITFTYDALAQQFNYAGDAAGSIAYNPATDSGTTFTVAGVSFAVTGTPATGDSFSFGDNSGGSGDNANALLLADLQTAHTMEGGSTSFQGAYSQLVGQLGTQTRSAQATAEAQASLLTQAQESRDATSGVNLDEEAANLVRFQQAYQAIAQVISAAETTFQTLMNALGR